MNRLQDALTKVARQLKIPDLPSHSVESFNPIICSPRKTLKPSPPIVKDMVRLNYRAVKNGVKSRPASLQNKIGCVNSTTNPASSPFDLKGVVAKLSFSVPQPIKHIHPPTVYSRFFNLTFYPVNHPLSLTRKSKPAVLVMYNSNEYLNFTYPPTEFASLKNKLTRYNGVHNISAFSYAVCRKKAATLVKRFLWKFIKVGVRENLKRVDGLYVFYLKQFPSSREELLLFEKNMGTALTQILKSDYNSPTNPHYKKIVSEKFNLASMKKLCGIYNYDKAFIREAESVKGWKTKSRT